MLLTFIDVKTRCTMQFISKNGNDASASDFEYDVMVPTETTIIELLDQDKFTKAFEKELTHLIRDDEDLKKRIERSGYRRFTMRVIKTQPEIPFLFS